MSNIFFRKILFLVCFFAIVWAQNVQELQKKIEQQDERIRQLEQRLNEQAGQPISEQHLEKLVDKYIDKKFEDNEIKFPLTFKRKNWIQFDGVSEIEYVDYRLRDDAVPNSPQAHFKLDRITLGVKVHFHEYIHFYTALEFDRADDGTKLDKAYMEFNAKDWVTSPRIRVGMNAVTFKPSRRTERFPIIGTAFYRDEEIGIQYQGSSSFLYWGLDLTMALELDDAGTGEDRVGGLSDIIQDDRHDGRGQENFLGRASVGVKHDFKAFGKVNLMGFFQTNRLDDEDISFLSGLSDYDGDEDDDRKNTWGVLGEYSLPINLGIKTKLHTQAMFISDHAGELERRGYYFQASHEYILNYDLLYSVEPFVRYGRFNIMNIDTDPTNPLTYDREEFTLALIFQIVKNVKLKVEYTFEDAFLNSNNPDEDDISLDYLGIMLESKF